MKTVIFNEPSSVDEKELEADMLKLPPWRRNQAMKYRFLIDRVLCSKSFLMLLQAAEETYGPLDEGVTFGYGKYGKPFIREYPEIQFNLSHCPRGIICAVNDSPVGCDIEEIPGQLDTEFCKSCFNEAELSRIISSDEPCTEFTRLWTMKEALLKFHGLGLNENLRNLLTPEILNKVNIVTQVCYDYGYVYSIVSGRES